MEERQTSYREAKGIEKVYYFLKEAQTYYLATIDGNKPRVRPFGTALLHDGRLYIQTGKKKDVSRQIGENPSVIDDLTHYQEKAQALLGDRIRTSIKNTELAELSDEHRISASMGFTYFKENDPGIEEVIARADEAVYEAKAAGRDNWKIR